ncbi:hypothetical protein NADFUDRAFT_70506 [Nadsonia fulvescens var. elongata DSM 6958]|uniref:Purine-cytosine permease n=1 Tax=Nadsonia fulvescens var. elongata DSM 6958 TaxID=857566 RepID=A0A1E3PHL5_9ASCO|nr:hypothetical protein NADFUDRAFT_70506 [Nadsonia fulvescens var. elongata DSM 6958]
MDGNGIKLEITNESSSLKSTPSSTSPPLPTWLQKFQKFSAKLDSYGLETKGIQRTDPQEREGGYRQLLSIMFVWISACGSLTSMSGFFLGPLLFGLSLKDSISSSMTGIFLGSGVAAYGATFGPRSGLRQMVGARFCFGWWPAKGLAVLNFITLLGWSVVNCVFGGQVIKALSNGRVPLEPGIVIIAVISLIVAIFGIKYVAMFEKYCALPINITFILLFIVSARNFDVSTPSTGNSQTIVGNWLSFFCSSFGIVSVWIAIASDYYVTFPESTPSWQILGVTWLGIFLPTALVGTLGICIASGYASVPKLMEAYNTLGNGGLLDAAFSPWKGGGKFLLAILYISLISNNILNTYSIAFSVQTMGRYFLIIPRYVWTFISTVIFLVLSLAGRNKLSTILNNFLPMIGYWSMIYFVILLEENFIFRRKNLPGLNDAYDWKNWDTPSKLPRGYAAFLAFAIGAAGAALGMCQAYYVGVVAAKVGDYGADLGIWLCAGMAGLSYPILRVLEKKFVGLP